MGGFWMDKEIQDQLNLWLSRILVLFSFAAHVVLALFAEFRRRKDFSWTRIYGARASRPRYPGGWPRLLYLEICDAGRLLTNAITELYTVTGWQSPRPTGYIEARRGEARLCTSLFVSARTVVCGSTLVIWNDRFYPFYLTHGLSLTHTTPSRSLEEYQAGAPMATENGRQDEDPHDDPRSPLAAGIRILTGNALSKERVAAPDPKERVLTQFNPISIMPPTDPRAPSGFVLPLTNNIHMPASAPGVVRNPVTSAIDTAEHIVVPGWKKRNIGVEGPKTRTPPSDKSAIERRLMEMKDRSSVEIFEPVVGTNFDSRQEAYDFYNLYSWEHGFGIPRGKSRLIVIGWT